MAAFCFDLCFFPAFFRIVDPILVSSFSTPFRLSFFSSDASSDPQTRPSLCLVSWLILTLLPSFAFLHYLSRFF